MSHYEKTEAEICQKQMSTEENQLEHSFSLSSLKNLYKESPPDLSNWTFCDDGKAVSTQSNMVVMSHFWPLSNSNVDTATEKLKF